MTLKKAAIVDIDGCVLNWKMNLPFMMNQLGLGYKIKNIHTADSDINADSLFINCTPNEIVKYIGLYSEHEVAKYIPAYSDAYQALSLLAEDHTLIALSKFGHTVTTWQNRTFNLNALFPQLFKEVICINYHQKKSDYVLPLRKDYQVMCFIDDRLNNITDIEENIANVPCLHVDRGTYPEDALLRAVNDFIKKPI